MDIPLKLTLYVFQKEMSLSVLVLYIYILLLFRLNDLYLAFLFFSLYSTRNFIPNTFEFVSVNVSIFFWNQSMNNNWPILFPSAGQLLLLIHFENCYYNELVQQWCGACGSLVTQHTAVIVRSSSASAAQYIEQEWTNTIVYPTWIVMAVASLTTFITKLVDGSSNEFQ